MNNHIGFVMWDARDPNHKIKSTNAHSHLEHQRRRNETHGDPFPNNRSAMISHYGFFPHIIFIIVVVKPGLGFKYFFSNVISLFFRCKITIPFFYQLLDQCIDLLNLRNNVIFSSYFFSIFCMFIINYKIIFLIICY